MDILKETEALYLLQKKRVDIDAQWEEQLKKTFPSLNQDVRLLKDILTDLERRRKEAGAEDKPVIPSMT